MIKLPIIQTWSYLQCPCLRLEAVAASRGLAFQQLGHCSPHADMPPLPGVNPQLCPGCAFQSLSSPPLGSHGPIFLSGFLYGRPGGVEWWGQSAEEPSQQGEAQAPPGTEHGPAIAMTDVLWQPIDVARIAGQLKIDPGYACAEWDDAASTCRRKARGFYTALRQVNYALVFSLSIFKVMNFQNQELPLRFFLQCYQPLSL